MELEEFLGQENINNFEKLLLVYLQFKSFKSYKDLEPIFKVSGVTIRKAIANLRKLGLINKYEPVKLSLQCKEIFTHENTECKEIFTYKNDTCKESFTSSNEDLAKCKEMFTSDNRRCKENFTPCKESFTFSKKTPFNYINTDLIKINRSIYIEEGKSSLTSFASTSRRNFTTNSEIVNDLGHENLNSVQKLSSQSEPANTLAEIAKAPAKRKRTKKTVESFIPPSSSEEVEICMQNYASKAYERYPYLLLVDIQRNSDDFLSHFRSNGWKQKNGNAIVDWKAAAEKWIRQQADYIKKGTAEPKQLTLQEQQLFDSLTHNQNIDEQRFNNAIDVTDGASDTSTQVQAFTHLETKEEFEARQARELEEYKKKYGYTN